jgi:hypothetical protein
MAETASGPAKTESVAPNDKAVDNLEATESTAMIREALATTAPITAHNPTPPTP